MVFVGAGCGDEDVGAASHRGVQNVGCMFFMNTEMEASTASCCVVPIPWLAQRAAAEHQGSNTRS